MRQKIYIALTSSLITAVIIGAIIFFYQYKPDPDGLFGFNWGDSLETVQKRCEELQRAGKAYRGDIASGINTIFLVDKKTDIYKIASMKNHGLYKGVQKWEIGSPISVDNDITILNTSVVYLDDANSLGQARDIHGVFAVFQFHKNKLSSVRMEFLAQNEFIASKIYHTANKFLLEKYGIPKTLTTKNFDLEGWMIGNTMISIYQDTNPENPGLTVHYTEKAFVDIEYYP